MKPSPQASKKSSLCYIGLGSNLDSPYGNPLQTLKLALQAIDNLEQVSIEKCSSCYLSKPIGPQNQNDYFNAVVSVSCTTEPLDLLKQLQHIEAQYGRKREHEQRWGARTLDLDILLFDKLTITQEKLIVPHPELENRAFVILPLYELDPHLLLPRQKNMKTLAENCEQDGIIKLSDRLWHSQ